MSLTPFSLFRGAHSSFFYTFSALLPSTYTLLCPTLSFSLLLHRLPSSSISRSHNRNPPRKKGLSDHRRPIVRSMDENQNQRRGVKVTFRNVDTALPGPRHILTPRLVAVIFSRVSRWAAGEGDVCCPVTWKTQMPPPPPPPRLFCCCR